MAHADWLISGLPKSRLALSGINFALSRNSFFPLVKTLHKKNSKAKLSFFAVQ